MSFAYNKKDKPNFVRSKTKDSVKSPLQLPYANMPERGITQDTCKLFGVRMSVSPETGQASAYYFPYYDQRGNLTGWKVRDLTKDKYDDFHFTTIGKVGVECQLFGQNVANKSVKTVFLCEGELDAMACAQVLIDGVKNTKWANMLPSVVSLSCGTANGVEAVMHNEHFVKGYQNIVLCFDNDSATEKEYNKGIRRGKEATDEVAGALMSDCVSVIQYPDGFKDPTNFLEEGKGEKLRQLLLNKGTKYTAEKIVLSSQYTLDEVYKPKPQGVMIEAFPKLSYKLKGFRKREMTIVTALAGAGKCFAPGTRIMMADSTIKNVEDISVGDKVLGPDGLPRRVLNLSCGEDDMYLVKQTKGVDYIVNSQHILSLKWKDRNWRPEKFDQINNIPIKDYQELSISEKKVYKGWVPKEPMVFEEEYPCWEPYMIGLWLADGTCSAPNITINRADKELAEAIQEFAYRNGYTLNNREIKEKHYLCSIKGGFIKEIHSLGLFENKHIPWNYKFSSKEDRLNLLAGYLDGDGYLSHNIFEFCCKHEQLFDDLCFIARSLGFKVTTKKVFKKCQNFEGAYYHKALLYGDIDQLPMRIPRKKPYPRKQIKDPTITGVEVEKLGRGEYYGFEVDGDHLFLLEDFTVVHNSSVVSEVAYELGNAGNKVGMIFLEEEDKETIQRLSARYLKINYNKFKFDPFKQATREQLQEAKDWVDDKYVFLDHFGSLKTEILINKIRAMMAINKVDFIILDHLSMVVSGLATTDERKLVDMVMTELAAFTASHDIGLIVVSHLNRDGASDMRNIKAKEEPFWVRVRKEDLRSSASIEQLAWVVLGIEAEVMPDRSRGRVRLTVLKNRPTGWLGEADTVKMDDDTGLFYDASDETLFTEIQE